MSACTDSPGPVRANSVTGVELRTVAGLALIGTTEYGNLPALAGTMTSLPKAGPGHGRVAHARFCASLQSAAGAAGSDSGCADGSLTESQVQTAGNNNSEQPAEVRSTQQSRRNRSLQRRNQSILDRPASHEPGEESDDAAPVDVAIGAGLGRGVKFGDVDAALSLDQKVGQDDAGP